ncbi:hypothetical protein BJ742DRAFT_320267 [Cladochytrium replicatum]|nr:hypothetical protein BJ742DRAFT_320267 [Cladochytrium replicatum]
MNYEHISPWVEQPLDTSEKEQFYPPVLSPSPNDASDVLHAERSATSESAPKGRRQRRVDPGLDTVIQIDNGDGLEGIPYFGTTAQLLSELVSFENRNNPMQVGLLNSQDQGGVEGLAYMVRTDLANGLTSRPKELEDQDGSEGGAGLRRRFGKAVETIKMGFGGKEKVEEAGESLLNLAAKMEPIDFAVRVTVYGRNMVALPPTMPIYMIVWDKIKDDAIIKVLVVGAIIVGIIGMIQNPATGWLDAVAIVIAVLIVTVVSSVNDFAKEKKFRKLVLLQTDKKTKVIRNGVRDEISSWDVVVGDLVELAAGDEVPADGVYVRGTRVVVDESPLTGESFPVKKRATSPFMFAGCQVTEGSGVMLVTAVGSRSSSGQIQEILIQSQNEITPLQQKLLAVGSLVGKIGLAFGILVFLVLVIQWAMKLGQSPPVDWRAPALQFLKFFTLSVTVVVVAVPDGLPLAVTVSLGFSMFKMIKEHCFVRTLASAETMGGATCICTDKTGTLTENKMTVVRVHVGGRTVNGEGSGEKDAVKFGSGTLDAELRDLLCEAIAANSTCFIKLEDEKDGKGVAKGSKEVFVGSATEGALLVFARKLGIDYEELRGRTEYVNGFRWDFDSTRKSMSTLVATASASKGPLAASYEFVKPYRLHVKGASEIILRRCVSSLHSAGISTMRFEERVEYESKVREWASEGLRTLAIAVRGVDMIPELVNDEATGEVLPEAMGALGAELERDLILIALVGIKDPVRAEVPKAVRECQDAGLTVRMVTGDNILTASKIAKECGILKEGGVAMEGSAFAALSEEEKMHVIPTLQVLARSSPKDKYVLVSTLKRMGEIVAVTGDGTNDAPALKEADVGFAMGMAGTQIAINASDIVLLDDNFATLVRSIRWGRNVLNSVRKFLQFQISVNFSAVIITFISSALRDEPVFESAILLWVNLVMDSLGALALATDSPDENILQQPPHPRNASIISPQMYQYCVFQTIYQIVIQLAMLYALPSAIPLYHPELSVGTTKYVNSMISNTFVLMQVVNETLSRQLNHELNIFKGLGSNQLFLIIEFAIVAIQILIMCVGYQLFGFVFLDWKDWLVCIVLALIQVPYVLIFRIFMKCVPISYGGTSIRKPKPPPGPPYGKRDLDRRRSFAPGANIHADTHEGKRKQSIAMKTGAVEHDKQTVKPSDAGVHGETHGPPGHYILGTAWENKQ